MVMIVIQGVFITYDAENINTYLYERDSITGHFGFQLLLTC